MKIRLYFSVIAILLLIFCIVSETNSQIDGKQEATNRVENKPAVIKLREFYGARDYEDGYEFGRKLVEQFPENVELQAWFLVNMARNEMSREAVEAAAELVENNRENAWSWFALAHARIRSAQIKEAIPAAEKALKLMPDDEEFIFLYASSLLAQRKYNEIYAWLDKNSAKIKDRSRLLYVKAEVEYRQFADGKVDEARRKSSFENFLKARDLNPNSVNANYIYGLYLNADRRFADALPVLKKAVALAPNVAHVRQQFWKAILNGQTNKNEAQRKEEVVADLNAFLRLRSDSINALDMISAFYGRELGMPEKKQEIDRSILEKFPQSAPAERILIGQIRAFNYIGGDKKVDEKKKAEIVQMMKDFINRPQHHDENYLGEVYSKYFYQIKNDKNTTDAELLEVAENISSHQKYDTAAMHSMIVSGLSDRQMFREAEKFVTVGFEKVKEEIRRQRATVKDEKKNQDDSNSMNATLYGARGWLYFKQNRFDEAEKELVQAIKLSNEVSYFYNNLAQVYEAKNDFEKAEDAYIDAFSTFLGNDNPNLDKLKFLYRRRSGNLQGFDEYFERVKTIERARRKARILAAEIEDSQNVTPFVLKNLEAKPISFAALKGKVVVINIWGTWCAPCVGEMPEFEELYKKYRKDKEVAVLTINNDGDLKLVKKFMFDRKYDFAVLQDENYLETIEIDAFPTTWFIDRDGKISFVKIGVSDKLLEEFSWRIEELKKRR